MTEQELIDSMVGLTADARAVLQNILNYATQNGDIAFVLSGGVNVTVPSLPKQVAAYAAQQAADRLAYLNNFGGVPSSQTLTRDALGRPISVATTMDNGYVITESLTRDVTTGRVTAVSVIVTDPLGAVVSNKTKTLSYINGLYSGVQ